MTTERLDLPTLIASYGSEDGARELLERLRWPNGVACTKCGSVRVSKVAKRGTWRCLDCRMHFSVRAGTVLQDTKLPLAKWLLATYMVCEAKKGISSNQLKRMMGITYKSAWFLSHRIRGAMGQLESRRSLTGTVEVDETFHGGKPRWNNALGKNVPSSQRATVLGAVERGGEVRFRVSPNRQMESLKAFIEQNVDDAAPLVYTDSWHGYKSIIKDEDTRHEVVNHSRKEYVRGDVHTNSIESVWSLFKRSVVGTHHQLSVKHLPAYLDEVAFKYNNRDNDHIFRETLRVLVTADPMTYQELIAEE